MADPRGPDLERTHSGQSQNSALNETDFVRKISRHQSSHFYAAIEQIRNFETREDKCKSTVLDYLEQFNDDNEEDVLNLIFEYVDIPPLNRKSQFNPSINNYTPLLKYIENSLTTPSNPNSANQTPVVSNINTKTANTPTTLATTNTSPAEVTAAIVETTDANDIKESKDSNEPAPTGLSDAELLNLQRRIDFKWTIGENQNDFFPKINESTINAVYFADIQSQIVRKYQIAGSVRDPDFVKRRDSTITDEYLKDWDPCLDVYFYLVCYETSEATQFKGQVCFSNQWSTMLIFGIDEDFIREACETGEWEYDVADIELSPKKTSLMGRKRFLTKKSSMRAASANAIATTITDENNNNNKNNNGNDPSKKLVLFDSSSVHVLDDGDEEMDMLADLYDTCDIVAVDESDRIIDDNKESEPVKPSSNELFVICEIKLSEKEENSVILMAKNGKMVTKPLQSLITKYCVREQRDIDELKQGLESIKISKAQLDYIANNKVLDVE